MTVYRPYTAQFDRVVNAAELPAVPLLEKFRYWMDLKKYSKIIDRTQAEVTSFLAALPPDRIQTLMSIAQNTAVTVLIDHSGSMKEHEIRENALCVIYTILFLLNKLGIKHEISGFTTRSWRGGDSRKLWIKNKRPEKPGRLCDLLHIIYKSYDEDKKEHFKLLFRNLLSPNLLKENVDGEALEWAASRLASRVEQNKILFHVSDGAPVDDSTLHENYGDYLAEHLKSVIKALEEDGKISLYGIGVHFSDNEYFPRRLNVVSSSEASEIVCKYTVNSLIETLCNKAKQ